VNQGAASTPQCRTGKVAQRTDPTAKDDKPRLSRAEALSRVEKALAEVKYGTIEVKVEAGVPIWVLKHVRERAG